MRRKKPKKLRVGPRGRAFEVDPVSRTPSTEEDEVTEPAEPVELNEQVLDVYTIHKDRPTGILERKVEQGVSRIPPTGDGMGELESPMRALMTPLMSSGSTLARTWLTGWVWEYLYPMLGNSEWIPTEATSRQRRLWRRAASVRPRSV